MYTVLYSVDHEVYLTMSHVQDPISMLVSKLPGLCMRSTLFHDGYTGKDTLKSFKSKHKVRLKISELQYQEAKRHVVVSTEIVAEHFERNKELMHKFGIDGVRI